MDHSPHLAHGNTGVEGSRCAAQAGVTIGPLVGDPAAMSGLVLATVVSLVPAFAGRAHDITSVPRRGRCGPTCRRFPGEAPPPRYGPSPRAPVLDAPKRRSPPPRPPREPSTRGSPRPSRDLGARRHFRQISPSSATTTTCSPPPPPRRSGRRGRAASGPPRPPPRTRPSDLTGTNHPPSACTTPRRRTPGAGRPTRRAAPSAPQSGGVGSSCRAGTTAASSVDDPPAPLHDAA